MKYDRVSKHFESLKKELTKAELQELETRQEAQAQGSHCRPLSGDFELCAVLCKGMSCGDFEHGGGGPWCIGLIKCKGFSGSGDKCKAFEDLDSKVMLEF